MKFFATAVSLVALLFVFTSVSSLAEEEFPKLRKAKLTAAAENKDILVLFTGPTWCPPCQQLERDVWSVPERRGAIQKNFVIVYAERKQPGDGVTPAEVENHLRLAEQLGAPPVYPSFVLLDKTGKPVETIENYDGNAAELLDRLEGFHASREAQAAITPLLARAQATKDLGERAALLRDAAAKLPTKQVAACLIPELNRLADLDGDNSLGLRFRYRALAAVLELNRISVAEKPDRAIELTSLFLDEYKTETDRHPQLKSLYLRIRFQAYRFKNDIEKCREILNQLKLIDENPEEIERAIKKLK